jgi:hypothetical protein
MVSEEATQLTGRLPEGTANVNQEVALGGIEIIYGRYGIVYFTTQVETIVSCRLRGIERGMRPPFRSIYVQS